MTVLHLYIYMQINQSRAHISQPPPLWTSYTLSYYPPALIILGQDIWQLGASPTPWSLLKLFKLANPKPAYLALPIPSYTNHNKGSCSHFPSSFCLLTQPGASPCGLEWYASSPLGNCNKLSFQWQASPDLLASPYINNNKTYISKNTIEWMNQNYAHQ